MSGTTRDVARAAEAAPTARNEEAETREFRRQWALPPADRRRSWATFGISGRLSAGWIGTLLVFAVVSFGMIPGSIRAQNDARLLQAHGQSLVVDKVEVHVDYVSGKGGGYYTVDGVRVTLPWSTDPVELESVGEDPNASSPIYDPMQEGWQGPTAKTGYPPPLTVRVSRDANGVVVAAMWRPQYEYLVTADEPEGEAVCGVLCLVVAGLSIWLNRLRVRRRARRRGYRPV